MSSSAYRIIPAIMHPFRLGNGGNREKPAIMHPFVSVFRFREENAKKACTIAGFLMLSPDLIEKACTSAGFSKSLTAAFSYMMAHSLMMALGQPHSIPPSTFPQVEAPKAT
ncbi:hypothetical protein BC351_18970 [Paenibacillus ferrarius]|uniref:Uncharacterized protein n=1 Tax=Paenibacillus ferrarius TaxID=1469647 RepID=A0A1V4HPN4_9BACL|nr:hypothetical protein BC351_18970 [Paenibacillus ferrarius]